MDWVLVHAGHLVPLLGLGAWLGWAKLARARAGRSSRPAPASDGAGATGTAGIPGTSAAAPRDAAVAGGPLDLSIDARLLLMACSVGAAVVHADVISGHFQVSALYGWFFVLSALAQLAWGLMVVRHPDRALLVTGAIGNGLIVVLWLVTRTSGLPIGPTPWQAESVGAFDVLATVLELVLVIASVVLLTGTRAVRRSIPKYDSLQTSHMLANLHARPAPTENPAGRIGGLRRNGDERHLALAGADRGRRDGRPSESGGVRPTVSWIVDYLPRGNTLDPQEWRKRHSFLQWILLVHLPSLFIFGVALHHTAEITALTLVPPLLCLIAGHFTPRRRLSSLFITAGLVYCSAALVGLSRGSIEAHFHFFIMIGFIALYQDWLPFLWNIVFTVISHGVGSAWSQSLIFNHQSGELHPWTWSAIHGAAVLAACVGVVIFWRTTEDEQEKSVQLTKALADAEIGRRKFTSDMLVNLARRNQSLLYRQLGIINQLEEQERDPDALAELFRLDHLATRIRRNAESLLVLSGEGPPRTWSEPVLLLDVVRAAIAETEDLDRVAFYLDERLAVMGHTVTDLTHLLAELVENAVRFSPPEASVIIRLRPYTGSRGAHVLTIEDCGIGMRREDLDAANELLAHPQEVDLSVSQRLGLHVVARLAERHGISVSLSLTPGSGITAVVVLPESLFGDLPLDAPAPAVRQHAMPVGSVAMAGPAIPARPAPAPRLAASSHNGEASPAPNGNGSFELQTDFGLGDEEPWSGWWEPVLEEPRLDGPALDEPASGSSAHDYVAGNGSPVGNGPSTSLPTGGGHAAPEPPPVQEAPPGAPLEEGPLTRRVPQSHLAPELREQSPVAQPPPQAVPDGNRTREALSRYQASRRAARALVEGTDTDLDGRRLDSGRLDTDPPEPRGGLS
jgi:signal transduction histidine kinase